MSVQRLRATYWSHEFVNLPHGRLRLRAAFERYLAEDPPSPLSWGEAVRELPGLIDGKPRLYSGRRRRTEEAER